MTTDNPDWNSRKYLAFWRNSSTTRIDYYWKNALLKEGIKNLAAETEEAETEEAETEEAENEEAEIEEAEIEEAEIEEAETEEAETEEVTFFIKEQPFLLKKIKVMKRNTAVKTWNYYNFYVSKTLLYLKKMRLKMK